MEKKSKKSELIAFKATKERKEEIEKFADSLGLTVSGLVNLAISEYMKK